MKCQKEPDLSVGLCRHSLATNGLQAGTVCILKLFLPKRLFKDTNVCCFCKNKKLSAKNFAKAITSSVQIVLACCYQLAGAHSIVLLTSHWRPVTILVFTSHGRKLYISFFVVHDYLPTMLLTFTFFRVIKMLA